MSHQVLARKWRPRDFGSVVGQEHVVRALTQALRTQRLHHAYLFTGTRGVGKTTLARVLAKALNCETGIAPEPCGRCAACTGIDQGRFADYIEIDAASNRRVEEIAPLLENAVYAPVAGRYKVYTIDEVHMLSAHAFNAMLKTLEEPPAHVVFILATTDPQKVPVTVLSRCLQFNLKSMLPQAIAAHLEQVLAREGIECEAPALLQIGRAANGSMRDALSLLDQAIAFGGERVADAAVREMLGAVDRLWLERLLDALVAGDARAMVAIGDEMLAGGAPFRRALDELAGLLQRIALAAVGVVASDDPDAQMLERFAAAIDPVDLQVYYQIVIHGSHELALAPDPHAGFTMTLLRLHAFRPDSGGSARELGGPVAERAAPAARPSAAPAAPAARRDAAAEARAALAAVRAPRPGAAAPKAASSPRPSASLREAQPDGVAVAERGAAAAPLPAAPTGLRPPPAADAPSAAGARSAADDADDGDDGPPLEFDGDWPALAVRGRFGGMVRQFMQQSELLSLRGTSFHVRVPMRTLAEPGIVAKARDGLSAHFGRPVRLSVEVGSVRSETAASIASAHGAERQARAREAIEGDPFVQTLLTDFNGTIVPDSIKPQGSTGDSR